MKSSFLLCSLALLVVGIYCMDENQNTGGKADIPAGDASKNGGANPVQLIADAYARHLFHVFDNAYGQARGGFAQAVRDMQAQCDCRKGDVSNLFIPPSARAQRPASANPQYSKANPRPVVSSNASPPL